MGFGCYVGGRLWLVHLVCGEGKKCGVVPGEDQTLESPQVAGGEGQVVCSLSSEVRARSSLVPGEDQTLESPQVAGGEGRGLFQCKCKGYEVDPSLCACKGYEVDPSLSQDPTTSCLEKAGPQLFYSV